MLRKSICFQYRRTPKRIARLRSGKIPRRSRNVQATGIRTHSITSNTIDGLIYKGLHLILIFARSSRLSTLSWRSSGLTSAEEENSQRDSRSWGNYSHDYKKFRKVKKMLLLLSDVPNQLCLSVSVSVCSSVCLCVRACVRVCV